MAAGDYETTVRPEEVSRPSRYLKGYSVRTMTGDETWDASSATVARLATGGVDRVINLYNPTAYRGLTHDLVCEGPGTITVRHDGSDIVELHGCQMVRLSAQNGGWSILSVMNVGANGALVQVSSESDLPAPVGGVITLAAGVSYHIIGTVDITPGTRIALGGIVSIFGSSSETSFLNGSGLGGQAFITGGHTLPMRNLSITADGGPAVAIDGLAQKTAGENVALDWRSVNFVDCANVGTIKDVSNFIMTESALLNSSSMTFDGSIDTIGWDGCLFNPQPASTAIEVASGATINRRFRIIYSAFVVLSGETGIDLDSNNVTIPNEAYILDTVAFGGGGTYLSGDDFSSPSSLFVNNTGIVNSASVAHYYMLGNSTATTISTSGTFVKAAGATLDGPNIHEFSQTDNRATYDGNLAEFYLISVNAALTAGNNQQLSVAVAKNGTVDGASEMRSTSNGGARVESIGAQSVIELAPGDYFEVWVTNNSATTSVTVTDLQVVARRIS